MSEMPTPIAPLGPSGSVVPGAGGFVRRVGEPHELKRADLTDEIGDKPPPQNPAFDLANTLLASWLWTYTEATPGCQSGADANWAMFGDALRPHHYLRLSEKCGGQSFAEDEFWRGAPELLVEVAAESASSGLNWLEASYAKAGVKEYLVVLLEEKEVHWGRAALTAEKGFDELPVEPDGLIRSQVFPGLWLNPPALLEGDATQLMKTLESGLLTPAHAEFAARIGGLTAN